MNPSRLRVTIHAMTRARERCPALANADFPALEDALRAAIAKGSPWGRSDKGGPRHVLVEIEGTRLVVALVPSRDGPYLMTQTVLTVQQALANAAAWPGAVAGRFKGHLRSRRVRG